MADRFSRLFALADDSGCYNDRIHAELRLRRNLMHQNGLSSMRRLYFCSCAHPRAEGSEARNTNSDSFPAFAMKPGS